MSTAKPKRPKHVSPWNDPQHNEPRPKTTNLAEDILSAIDVVLDEHETEED